MNPIVQIPSDSGAPVDIHGTAEAMRSRRELLRAAQPLLDWIRNQDANFQVVLTPDSVQVLESVFHATHR